MHKYLWGRSIRSQFGSKVIQQPSLQILYYTLINVRFTVVIDCSIYAEINKQMHRNNTEQFSWPWYQSKALLRIAELYV